MKQQEISAAAEQFMDAAMAQFKDPQQQLYFVCTIASLSLSAMEAIGGEAQLRQFVADATGPNRMRTEIVKAGVQ